MLRLLIHDMYSSVCPNCLAFEIVRWDWGFVSGKGVSLLVERVFLICALIIVSFFNGGLLFSSLVLSAIALISLYSFLLLVKTKFVVSGSFGGISIPVMPIRLHC